MADKTDFIEIAQFVGEQALANYNGIKIPYTEKKKLLQEWVNNHPQHNSDGTINQQRQKEFLNKLMIDSHLSQLISDYLEERYPIYVSEKEMSRKQMAFGRFIKAQLPTQDQVLRAFTWFLCPSVKAEFWNNLAKFDSFMKNVSNTILDTKYQIDPTMLILYSSKGRTGKSFRLEAIQETVKNLGFPSKIRTTDGIFGTGFHSVDDYNNGLMVINEWSNQSEINDTLLKNLIEKKPITIHIKNKNDQTLKIDSCITGASNNKLRLPPERRVSVIDFAEIPFTGDTDSNESCDLEFVTQDEKVVLFQYILQTYYRYYCYITEKQKSIDNNQKNKQTFSFIGNVATKSVGQLNSTRCSTTGIDTFIAYLDAMETMNYIDLSNFSSWRCKKNLARLSTRDLDAIIDDLVNNGHLAATSRSRIYNILTDVESIKDHLFPPIHKSRYTYQEAFDLLKTHLDLSFLPINHSAIICIPSESRPFDFYTENSDGEFECLNDFKSLSPTNEHKSIRSQDNVYLDKFLFEIDYIPNKSQEECLECQKKTLQKLCDDRVIYRAVFSGKKSIHFVIKLDPETSDIPTNVDEYKFVWKLLAKKYGFSYADRACNDPCRLTRRPNVIRHDTNHNQDLLCFDKNKISLKWFDEYVDFQTTQKMAKVSSMNNINSSSSDVSTFIGNYMKKHELEYKEGQRNTILCKLRGALDTAGIEYDDQDLLDYGFDEEIVNETNNLSQTKRI